MTELEDALLAHYENFSSALVLVAMYGPDPLRETAYAQAREWMRAHDREIDEFLTRTNVANQFRELFSAKTIQEMLDADDGGLIESVTKVSAALYTTAGTPCPL